jgi:hypothetical protein
VQAVVIGRQQWNRQARITHRVAAYPFSGLRNG